MSIHDQIETLFIASENLSRPGWWRVRIVKHYGRNFGRPEFERGQTVFNYKAATKIEAEEKAEAAFRKRNS